MAKNVYAFVKCCRATDRSQHCLFYSEAGQLSIGYLGYLGVTGDIEIVTLNMLGIMGVLAN